MGSSYRSKSAHMADIKGKRILYEDDDEPIKLTDQDASLVIKEYHLSLIGKILNPKKQNVEKLIQTMPAQWGVQDRVTANDVLGKGPFHYNYCMFVLVRREPIVHDDYPWTIPFRVELVGIPLHLWTVSNMKSIGGRIGHVHEDSIELSEGPMLIDVDSRRLLKFMRKIESPDGDEVTIEIKYNRLFKHCTTCGLMMTHEKVYCPMVENTIKAQTERARVFARVQIPQEQTRRQPLLSDSRVLDHKIGDISRQPLHRSSRIDSYGTSRTNVTRHSDHGGIKARYSDQEKGYSNSRMMVDSRRHQTHADRIMRGRDNKPREIRYGGSRNNTEPYDRKRELAWREKPRSQSSANTSSSASARNTTDAVRDVVPYEQEPRNSIDKDQYEPQRHIDEDRSGEQPKKRLASCIVSPVLRTSIMGGNVTIRNKDMARSLTYSPQSLENALENEQMIGAFNGTEILEANDEEAMDCDDQGDGLLGEELMDVEGNEEKADAVKRSKDTRGGNKVGASLSTQNKKAEFFGRGSPRMRPMLSSKHNDIEKSKRHGLSSTKARGITITDDGSMVSKNPSNRH